MKIYITSPFRDGKNREEIEALCEAVRSSGFEDFSFIRDIEHYEKMFNDPNELMQRAKEEVEKCGALLINYDGPANGRMIELGIAYALGKKIVLVTVRNTPVKDTVRGVADAVIEYEQLEDISVPLSKLHDAWR